jgi:hypothetical protein
LFSESECRRTWKRFWLFDTGAKEMRGRVHPLGNMVPSCGSTRQGPPEVEGFEKSEAGFDGMAVGPLVSTNTQSPFAQVTPDTLAKSGHGEEDEQLLAPMMLPLLLPLLPLIRPLLLPLLPLLPPPLEPLLPSPCLPLEAQAATTAARPMASRPQCEKPRIRFKTKSFATETSTSTKKQPQRAEHGS